MKSIAQDAQRLSLLFQFGVIDAKAAISWADPFIVEMDSPPDLLIQLSTTAPEKTGDILSCLRALGLGADFWTAFRSTIPQIRAFIAFHPELAERVADHMSFIACTVGDVPEDLFFINRYDDAFLLARQDMYGDVNTIREELIREMDEFGKRSDNLVK